MGYSKFELGGKNMENDYSSFLEKNDDGSVKSFDESKFASYVDSLISKGVNSGVENYKNKVAKEQELSKMSDQEKFTKEKEDFEKLKSDWETTMKQQKRELVVEKAKAKLANNFSESEIALLTANVSDDEKSSLKYIDDLVAERTKFIDAKTKEIIEKIQSKQPVITTQSNTKNESTNQNAVKQKTAQEIKNIYK